MRPVTRDPLPVTRKVSPRRRFPGNWQRATGNFAIALIVTMLAQPALACPVCFGSPGDPMVKATNNGVWVMLGIIGFVQVGFAAMFWSFWRRNRRQKRFRESFHVIEGGPLS